MANELGQCFTPTSLWNLLREGGTGKYHIVVDGDGVYNCKSITAKKQKD